ncbi:MAG: PAS domain-containing sensor histidine kinase [Gemmatimonadota bacterium]|nr:MAG: PAS domain-containing sensor histidine kinase [Gemmatimonadota bacterium]
MARLRHEQRILVMTLLAGLPGTLVAMILLWTGDFALKLQWTLTLIVSAGWLGYAFAVKERVVRPLQALSNMLAALREGDYSIRARRGSPRGPLGLAMMEANILGETLRGQRLGALEATALLRRVMEEIDVAVFAFDAENRLRLVNRAGERLLGRPLERAIGRGASSLGLARPLEEGPGTIDLTFQGRLGRWDVRHTTFRQEGVPHRLLVLTDLSQALRQEERQAWKRLIRVLSHEINNSLAPIKSTAASLLSLTRREPRPADLDDDVEQGLRVISGRSEALSRFMASYADLARLPPPTPGPVDVGAWVRRVAELETRLPVSVCDGPELTIEADGDQLDQLLINLVRNGVDAALETGGAVQVGWREDGGKLEVWVRDEGLGLSDTRNLFVPFYSTRPGGSGIGLVLSLQIAEGHGGALELRNRGDRSGCVATLTLPKS